MPRRLFNTVTDRAALAETALTLAAGAAGAAAGWLISLPVYILTGPALVVTALGLIGVRTRIVDPLRDVAFLIIGVGIGAGVTREATDAVARWPFAFALLGVTLIGTLLLGRRLLVRRFGFDDRGAVLAASPGHLSFVLGVGASMGADVPRIAVVQSIRLLALTLVVPFVAVAFGVRVDPGAMTPGVVSPWADLAVIFAASLALGVVLKRLKAPAPILLGGLVVSSLAHATEATHGAPPPALLTPALLIVGALIGARFAGTSLADLRAAAGAGLAITAISSVAAALASLPVAWVLEMPVAHVLVAFAPGGLETMIAMGAVLGANPGFVAACHVGRLLLLTVLVPALLAGRR